MARQDKGIETLNGTIAVGIEQGSLSGRWLRSRLLLVAVDAIFPAREVGLTQD